MMRLAAIAVLLAVFAATEALCGVKADMLRENRLLESELKLAGRPGIYAVFDLRGKRISIKARGMALTEFPIRGASVWGTPADPVPLKLTEKDAFKNPKRVEIEPQRGQDEGESTLNALEVKDMPSRYVLRLDHIASIHIRPSVQGTFWRLLEAGRSLAGLVVLSFRSGWSFLRGKPFTEVDITLEEKDARTLYWTMHEGTPCILAMP